MLHKKTIIASIAILILIAGSLFVAASSAVDQIATLAGPVVFAIAPGTAVAEGDTLVKVKTITGSVPAARASTKGVVTEVLVNTGDSIRARDVVARIQVGK